MKELMKTCSRPVAGLCLAAHIHPCPPPSDISPFHAAILLQQRNFSVQLLCLFTLNTKTSLKSTPQSQPELHAIHRKSIPRLRNILRNKKKPGWNLQLLVLVKRPSGSHCSLTDKQRGCSQTGTTGSEGEGRVNGDADASEPRRLCANTRDYLALVFLQRKLL